MANVPPGGDYRVRTDQQIQADKKERTKDEACQAVLRNLAKLINLLLADEDMHRLQALQSGCGEYFRRAAELSDPLKKQDGGHC